MRFETRAKAFLQMWIGTLKDQNLLIARSHDARRNRERNPDSLHLRVAIWALLRHSKGRH